MKYLHLLNFSLIILFSACNSNKELKEMYLDKNLPVDKRVELLLNTMTLDEKIGQMCQYVGEPSKSEVKNVDEEVQYELDLGETAELIKQSKIGSFLKVPTYKEANYLQKMAEESRLKIPLLIATDAIHGHGMYQEPITIYPTEIGMAASFDTDLANKVAKYTAAEMRATGYHWTFSPNIEIARDGRWGRFGETFGEDPLLVSEMGKAMIEGYQGDNFGDSVNVIACAKHFVGGGISSNGLNGAAADISERTLHEIFFPPFIEAIKSNVYTIMPAHNEINGIPCHAHHTYLSKLMRDTWDFKGFYVSDWMDIERLETVHKVAASQKEAAKLAVLAGLDVHMQGPGFFDHVKELVNEGAIPEKVINESVRKILYAKFQLGLFENRYVNATKIKNTLMKKEHLDLALEVAQKSMVLLKNEANILPLSKQLNSIFITGPNANSQALLGDWSRNQPDENITTVIEGIRTKMSATTKIDFMECESYHSYSDNFMEEAKKRAKSSDVTIVAVGENSIRFDKDKTSAENLDRPILELAGQQLELVKALVSSGKPVIVVLINGGPIASPWLVENVAGIIEAWEPGMYGGQAIADVIFGDYNPGGKLPITIPRSVGHIQNFYNQKPSAFHRGCFFQSSSEALFEFGFGLSYTQFKYSNLKVKNSFTSDDIVTINLTIENNGELGGDEVVLIYINDIVSSVTTPVKKLVSFDRLHLEPKEKKEFTFDISSNSFKMFNQAMDYVIEPGEFEIIIGNNIIVSTILYE
ncbi:MAG: glycoside hydrolase family 3 C-terminal domain-containing protein [Salinivirgaceae bacterium]|jgi:beta-glucosidase|nr:glycoside hydrolase family 3 C-terminal domain-containing protein [Salinivirgaceae bacterium]